MKIRKSIFIHPQVFKRQGAKNERDSSTKGGLCERFGYTAKLEEYAK